MAVGDEKGGGVNELHLFAGAGGGILGSELLGFLQTLKGKVVLSGYDSDLYAAYLDGWRKECKVAHDTQGGKKIECLWMNYNPQLTLF